MHATFIGANIHWSIGGSLRFEELKKWEIVVVKKRKRSLVGRRRKTKKENLLGPGHDKGKAQRSLRKRPSKSLATKTRRNCRPKIRRSCPKTREL